MDNSSIQSLSHRVATQFYIGRSGKNPFTASLVSLSREPLAYEDGDLLDLALSKIPLEQLFTEAEKNHKKDPSWGEQDYTIQELVK